MFDLQQGLARKSVSRSCIRTWKADFDFWGEQRTKVYDEYGGSNSVHVGDDGDQAAEFQYGDESDDHNYGPSSPQLWTSMSPLLPRNRHHHHSNPTPTSRLQAIIDGRRELMEMIQDLPESSYELSLKDIVDEQASDQMGGGVEGASLNCEPDQGIKSKQKVKKKKKINMYCKKRQISRCQSMDSGVFLLKMFFPVSLGLQKSKTCNCLKVSPSPSMEGSEKTVDREWWKMSFLAIRKSMRSGSSSSAGSRSSRSSSSSRCRQDDTDFAPGCWSFNKKSRSKGQSGCLL